MLYTGWSGYCPYLIYFERVKRHTICKNLDIKNISSAFEKSHYIRNSFRSEIKNVASCLQLAAVSNTYSIKSYVRLLNCKTYENDVVIAKLLIGW